MFPLFSLREDRDPGIVTLASGKLSTPSLQYHPSPPGPPSPPVTEGLSPWGRPELPLGPTPSPRPPPPGTLLPLLFSIFIGFSQQHIDMLVPPKPSFHRYTLSTIMLSLYPATANPLERVCVPHHRTHSSVSPMNPAGWSPGSHLESTACAVPEVQVTLILNSRPLCKAHSSSRLTYTSPRRLLTNLRTWAGIRCVPPAAPCIAQVTLHPGSSGAGVQGLWLFCAQP